MLSEGFVVRIDNSIPSDQDLGTDVPGVGNEENEMLNLLYDLHTPIGDANVDDENIKSKMLTNFHATETSSSSLFNELMNEARDQLYPGCTRFSSLMYFLVKLMHMKVINGWSNKSFDMLLDTILSCQSQQKAQLTTLTKMLKGFMDS